MRCAQCGTARARVHLTDAPIGILLQCLRETPHGAVSASDGVGWLDAPRRGAHARRVANSALVAHAGTPVHTPPPMLGAHTCSQATLLLLRQRLRLIRLLEGIGRHRVESYDGLVGVLQHQELTLRQLQAQLKRKLERQHTGFPHLNRDPKINPQRREHVMKASCVPRG